MVLVLCYDVSSDRRRGRLFRKLKGFLIPVQESVFEGHLPERRWEALLKVIGGCIDREADSVRIYRLCGGCSGVTTLIGRSPPVTDPEVPVIL